MSLLTDVIPHFVLSFVIGAMLGVACSFPLSSFVLARRGFRRAINSD